MKRMSAYRIRLYGFAVVGVLLVSACAYFEKPAVPTSETLIDQQAFITERQQKRAIYPRPILPTPNAQRRINLWSPPAEQQTKHSLPASSPISFRLVEVPLRIFTAMLSELSGYNIVIAANINGTISQHSDEVGWREALQTVAELHGLAVDEQRAQKLIRVYKPTAPRGEVGGNNPYATRRNIELFKLRYADPDRLAALLKSVLGEQPKSTAAKGSSSALASAVLADKGSHSLIVQGDPQTIELAATLIQTMDVPQRQVMIEAFIVEAGADFTRALGARLGRERDGLFNTDTINGPYLNLPVAGASGGLGLTFGSARIRVELSALERAGKSRLISNPKIFTLDNQPAMIFEGSEVPYQTVSDSGTQTEFKQAGLKLAVTPSIVNEQHLMLDLAINKDTVDTRLQNPPITRRELTSRLLVRTGDVVVIGGIYLRRQVRAFEGMPFITQLPFIGNWFRHRRREGDVKELMVFIAPQIV